MLKLTCDLCIRDGKKKEHLIASHLNANFKDYVDFVVNFQFFWHLEFFQISFQS